MRRPVTIIVMAALMMLLSLYSFFSMSKDIFPAVNIPQGQTGLVLPEDVGATNRSAGD